MSNLLKIVVQVYDTRDLQAWTDDDEPQVIVDQIYEGVLPLLILIMTYWAFLWGVFFAIRQWLVSIASIKHNYCSLFFIFPSACTYIIYMMLQYSDGWKEALFLSFRKTNYSPFLKTRIVKRLQKSPPFTLIDVLVIWLWRNFSPKIFRAGILSFRADLHRNRKSQKLL